MSRLRVTVGVVLLLLIGGTVGGAFSLAGAASMTTIDADHALATEQQKTRFASQGVARAKIQAPELTLTVAAEHEDCNADVSLGDVRDARNDWLCVRYPEEIKRTFRVYIPDEYWSPYTRKQVEPAVGDATASFEPIRDGNFTEVTFTVSGPTTVAWPINEEASWFAGAKERTLDNLGRVSGVSVASSDAWHYIGPTKLAGNATAYEVRAPDGVDQLVLEYNSSTGWSKVPEGESSYAPVYYQTKDGVNDRVWVFASESNRTAIPQVRYMSDASSTDRVSSALREISQIPTRLEQIINVDIPFVGGAG